ncbi:ribonuclease 3-like [Malania oleifera]|uniref:ribonuclease 3-like n=1 Tax=Malania oleifera TaxID=397392 RepID=UPI0025ADE910|nr:ribonuclease 3-like [Malania oleifera]
MKIDWASYGTTTNRQFWDHEWSKHGRDSGLQPSAYFELGLTLFHRVDLGTHLKSEGVYPTGQTVEHKKFAAAVSKAAGGKTVVLLCNKDKEGVVQLFEIDICLDHSTSANAYVNCEGMKSSCPDQFRLPKAICNSVISNSLLLLSVVFFAELSSIESKIKEILLSWLRMQPPLTLVLLLILLLI